MPLFNDVWGGLELCGIALGIYIALMVLIWSGAYLWSLIVKGDLDKMEDEA